MKPEPAKDSQCAAILHRLRSAAAEGAWWVSMPALVEVSGSYNIHSRIDELRHAYGIAIECKIETSPGCRAKFSFYRLAADPEQTANK